VSGPAKYRTDKEEENLATLLSCCGVIGYVRSKAEVLSLVQHILESRGKHVSVSHGWSASFQQHHPELVLRNPAPLSQAIRKPQIPKKHWLLTNSEGKPGQIFNMDESRVPLDAKVPKFVYAGVVMLALLLLATKHR